MSESSNPSLINPNFISATFFSLLKPLRFTPIFSAPMAAMQFWGVEVNAKQPCQVSLEDGFVMHLSQATLGDIKKDNETVTIHLKVGEEKFVLGMLSNNNPQLSFDLVFDENFEISHNWKNGTIHLMGYQNDFGKYDSDDAELDSSDSSEGEEADIPIAKENGQLVAPAAKAPAVKPKEDNKLKTEVNNESEEDDSSEEDDEDADSDDVDDSDEILSDSDGDEDSDEDSDDETPAKVADAGKKRPNADAKTSPQSKKAKIATPQKTDGKKGAKTPSADTPSSKKGGKTPAADTPSSKKGGKGDKTSKSAGSDVSCGSCKKTFKSDAALESHSKAKHGAK